MSTPKNLFFVENQSALVNEEGMIVAEHLSSGTAAEIIRRYKTFEECKNCTFLEADGKIINEHIDKEMQMQKVTNQQDEQIKQQQTEIKYLIDKIVEANKVIADKQTEIERLTTNN